jgi:hypothetical protein
MQGACSFLLFLKSSLQVASSVLVLPRVNGGVDAELATELASEMA